MKELTWMIALGIAMAVATPASAATPQGHHATPTASTPKKSKSPSKAPKKAQKAKHAAKSSKPSKSNNPVTGKK